MIGKMVEARTAQGGDKKKVLKHVQTSRSANGGFVAEHHFDNSGSGPYKESEMHTFGSDEGGKFMAHIAKVHGVKTDDDAK